MPVLDAPIDMNLNEFNDTAKFPNKIWLLLFPDGRIGGYFYKHDRLFGIACFSTENRAILFAEHIMVTGSVPTEMDFMDALDLIEKRRQIAKELQCVFLMDDGFDHPTATYWLNR